MLKMCSNHLLVRWVTDLGCVLGLLVLDHRPGRHNDRKVLAVSFSQRSVCTGVPQGVVVLDLRVLHAVH